VPYLHLANSSLRDSKAMFSVWLSLAQETPNPWFLVLPIDLQYEHLLVIWDWQG